MSSIALVILLVPQQTVWYIRGPVSETAPNFKKAIEEVFTKAIKGIEETVVIPP